MVLKSRSGYETQFYFNPADPQSGGGPKVGSDGIKGCRRTQATD